ncbi:MAG: hypothetical protein J0I41_20670 [Filimonas sp.]|nr:hypothetical protein [Filimonas sp.]
MFKKLLKIIIPFFSFQILIQAIDAFSGILLVRNLLKTEYAYFGIISSLASSALSTTISGMDSYLISKGIELKEYKTSFSKLFNELIYFLRNKRKLVLLVCVPIGLWMMLKNGVTPERAALFIILLIIDNFFRVRIQLYQGVFNIHQKFNFIQVVNLAGSSFRLLFVLTATRFLTGEIAYASMVLSFLVQLIILNHYSKKYIQSETVTKEKHKDFNKLYYSLLPVYVHTAFDGQIVILILTFFGNTTLLADVNAAGKLSLIVVAVNAFISNYITVKFAAIKTKEDFIKKLFFTSSIFIGFYIVSVFAIMLVPHWFIWLIGSKYTNLEPYLYLVVINICVGNFSGLLLAINFSKTWIRKNWLSIPLTILFQIVGLSFFPPKDFQHVWYYATFCALPTLAINVLFCYKGFLTLGRQNNAGPELAIISK